ncbi:MAG: I78 family peptidase inhibitor [Pigmentiphaga sp.]|nr:I78 family peptidase inhibitor [Pigmentiphaga sp.]
MIRLSTLGVFSAALLLAGCAGPGGSGPTSSTSGGSGPVVSESGRCDAAGVQNLVGQPYSERQAENARQRSGANSLRTLLPGQVMTMEYNPTRLTVVVGAQQEVMSVRCG